jgi:transcriptional regulator with XRE-family HTH domain
MKQTVEPLPFVERSQAFFKETRTNEGLTARVFAERIGTSYQNLSLIETKKSTPSVGLIEKVEKEFKVFMTERTRWP